MHERAIRAVLAGAMTAALIALFVAPEPRESAADERASQQIAEQALDSNSPSRVAKWRAAHEQIVRLDPNRPMASGAFVRSGLFHWYELSDADRREVMLAVEPMLRDGAFFDAMAVPLFQLTGDFRILRRANPGTEGVLMRLASMAVTNGLFDDYRAFREQLRQRRWFVFETTRRTAGEAELVALAPIPSTMADLALIQGILDELHVRPIATGRLDADHANALIDFALDHDLKPLDGLEAIVHIKGAASDPQRARLAVRLGQFDHAADIESGSGVTDRNQWHRYYVERAVAEMQRHESLAALEYLQKAGEGADVTAATEQIQRLAGNAREAAAVHATLVAHANKVQSWAGLCGEDVCNQARGALWSEGAPFALKLSGVQSDAVPPYAEVYADDALMSEGAVSPSLQARRELARGIHRIDVRLANPLTRNAVHRRIRIE